ncbi:MAG: nucleotidyl transferase AbiEii/AbiGii toxin family protein [Gallionellaceae bacterium]
MKENNSIATSIRQQLQNLAREHDQSFDQMLVSYALERVLYRLSKSPHRDRFVLKGALLFRLWFDLAQRPTRDADFLGFGSSEPEALADIFRQLAGMVEEDGLVFNAASVQAEDIRKMAGYPGVRISMVATLNRSRIKVQCDIGFGDAVTPAPLQQTYPTLLNMPAPVLAVYPLETVVAEKLEAIVKLTSFNTRMKDYFDMWVLMRYENLDRSLLPEAIRATFTRRNTALPMTLPVGLSSSFATEKQAMWQAFLTRSTLSAPPLAELLDEVREQCWLVLQAASKSKDN